jgi:hypothetical protein
MDLSLAAALVCEALIHPEMLAIRITILEANPLVIEKV